jgi:RNA-binding protein
VRAQMSYTTRMHVLSPTQRRAFKARAHHLEPVVIIGDAGLTPAVLAEIDVHLKVHELIKIRVSGEDRDSRISMIAAIGESLGASLVQHIGKILVMFRAKPAESAEKAGRKSPTHKPKARNKQRRTKRSYQGS